ncbi:prenyltransferase/squalene oxidase repeat-containing protein [Bacillus sp. FJAT-27251]|uniref:terpene cyclase/mutase family protein n=1 Tax=Bacillus sp. FJAT-27251 TaxID=1684142 RepID=UPI0006A76F58|nr:prenyltransferase/squalene oxidase repeat-containing protein [Bacillus sp. FJAT-27251]
MKNHIETGIQGLIDKLRKDQSPNGAWNFPFEAGISTDCFMIILLRTLEIDDEKFIKVLAERIMSKQEENGAWKLYRDEGDGNLSATVEAYYALLYSGYYGKKDRRLTAAKRYIVNKGGPRNTHMFTKVLLALTGQYKWPNFFPIPVEVILLPASFPINFYQFSLYGRAHLAPIMVLADRKFQLKTGKSPDLSELGAYREEEFFNQEDYRLLHSALKKAIKKLIGLPAQLHQLAIEKTKEYMISHIEKDGTFFTYFSSTFLMIFALLAMGYSKTHPVITNAVAGLKAMKTNIDGLQHVQFTPAAIWNTSLISYALQEAGVKETDQMISKANTFLLNRQHVKYGDWVIHNPNVMPGGWGFGDKNTFVPDVDDTTASLRSIARKVHSDHAFRASWDRGVFWLLSMQNKDGGWASFEKNTDSQLISLLPVEKGEYLLTDPSTPDLTGRTLEFLGNYTNLSHSHPAVNKGVRWLELHQKKDGSWYGRWGICYIYGTWAAVTGMSAVGVQPSHHSIQKAVNWLERIQNEDGGWGESCKSDEARKYVPLNASTLTHTAWAVDALLSVSAKPTTTINRGIAFLTDHLERDDWTTDYPKGQGVAGNLYTHYHSYRYLYPLLALAHYKNRFLNI